MIKGDTGLGLQGTWLTLPPVEQEDVSGLLWSPSRITPCFSWTLVILTHPLSEQETGDFSYLYSCFSTEKSYPNDFPNIHPDLPDI